MEKVKVKITFLPLAPFLKSIRTSSSARVRTYSVHVRNQAPQPSPSNLELLAGPASPSWKNGGVFTARGSFSATFHLHLYLTHDNGGANHHRNPLLPTRLRADLSFARGWDTHPPLPSSHLK